MINLVLQAKLYGLPDNLTNITSYIADRALRNADMVVNQNFSQNAQGKSQEKTTPLIQRKLRKMGTRCVV